MNKTIAMLTDFGTNDSYVGVMKAVINRIAPQTNIIDLSHAIAPQHVRQAAFTLFNTYAYFPVDTIFMVIVDPGVGTTRRPIAVRAQNYTFVAPDNGILSYALSTFTQYEAIALSNTRYHLQEISHTFHGRDIFAPVAAHLAANTIFHELGDPLKDLMILPEPELFTDGNRVIGEVVHIDHFGNITTSIGKIHWNDSERLTLKPAFRPSADSLRIRAEQTVTKIAGTTINNLRTT